ncbi:hypothetical protein GCM10010112_92340 [Actinoplanes lobatus]|uniref:Uncharacterized protein n=1 Tax=Actinoplanes lobatus TaxID=113568 RepID=A0A7W7HLG0_9ACTN|nr:hypothetical protein [Actinoplanes lobatus]MBB4752666.1 hypothetical protein [Actinoplanes lobatus]GGN98965.1 hypothetical protein GCM10010112_92340 [Actinoplanes lobatus]GIE46231.1 hypothetical protein Alo02nite_91290 [Actinoplanes lobatus]
MATPVSRQRMCGQDAELLLPELRSKQIGQLPEMEGIPLSRLPNIVSDLLGIGGIGYVTMQEMRDLRDRQKCRAFLHS